MRGAVKFQSPKEQEVTITLPHAGVISGMGIKRGITLIVGGGYHGKSTLLKALETGVYPHVAGDGREYVITDDTAAIMLELVQGEGGVFPADPDFVAELVNLAKTNGILLLVDEVQTGMGRTGTRFAFEQYGFTPDIFTTAKGLANGIPVGAMLAKNEFAPALAYGTHGSTFGGNPLVMSAAQATLTILDEVLPTLPEKVALFWDKLAEFKNLSVVDDVRGLGMMAGMSLTVPVDQVVADLLQEHIIVLSAGHNTLRLLPPLTIPTAQLLETLDKIKIQLDKI